MGKRADKLITRDVAYILDMSPDEVIFLVKRGFLKAKKVKSRWIYDISDVYKYKLIRKRNL